MNHERRRRPVADRTGPIRVATKSLRSPRTEESAPNTGALTGVIDEAVRTAYRVVDDYIELGWQSAARYRPNGGRPMNQPNSNVQEMTTLAMRFWFDMAQAWMMPLSETAPWRAWMGGSPDAAWDRGAESTPTPPTGSVGEEAGANARLALSVAVASQQPSQVTVDLQPGSVVENLTVQDLREIDGNGKPPLVAVRCEATDGRLRIELSVPRDQPAGVYTGAIVDRSRREARGTVSVVVSDPAETRSDG